MKKNLFLHLLLFSLLSAITSYAQNTATYFATRQEAIAEITRMFPSDDIDIYINPTEETMSWSFFLDFEPTKSWEHACATITIPRSPDFKYVSRTPGIIPPSHSLSPIRVKNRYGYMADNRPYVAKAVLSDEDIESAARTYAIIINGGINKNANHKRYWNDCSFIYQTLVNKYGVPKGNIIPLMSDGNNPGYDMKTVSGHYISQPLDLDDDGSADITLAATKNNLYATLVKLCDMMTEKDQLFIFVTGHGGYEGGSYTYLWNGDTLYGLELADMLRQFIEKKVVINAVFGQSNSGGFIEHFKKMGVAATAACGRNESSWSCPDMPYNEFLFHWTSALNGKYPNSVPVNADTDLNGRVTMEEAFLSAYNYDRYRHAGAKTPMFSSTPLSIGQDLAFNNIPPAADLYIKDNYADTGKEPNLTSDILWDSPSIWTRNNDDKGLEHENPVYSYSHPTATIYVKVHNRGRAKHDGKGKWLHVNWSLASTGFCGASWEGKELLDDMYVTGEHLRSVRIPEIEAGDSVTLTVNWALPADLFEIIEDDADSWKQHFCLTARILDTHLETDFPDGDDYADVRYSNKRAQKNLIVVDWVERLKYISVLIRNSCRFKTAYTVELVPKTTADESLYSAADIEMELSPKILQAWQNGGEQSENMYRAPGLNSRVFKFIDRTSKMKAFTMEALDFDNVKLSFNFKKVPERKEYSYYLVQRDENGKIVGGETFRIKSPTAGNLSSVSVETLDNGNVSLSVDDSDIVTTTWMNASGETIGHGDNLSVKPTRGNTEFHVAAVNADGELGVADISLDVAQGLRNVACIENGTLEIELFGEAAASDKLIITPAVGVAPTITRTLEEGSRAMTIDISSLPVGLYVVSYIENESVIDSRKVSVK